jgi:hypothetical protein
MYKSKSSGSKTNKRILQKKKSTTIKNTKSTKNKTIDSKNKKITKSKITKSDYSREDRMHIKAQIENLKSNEQYSAIFEILNEDPNKSYSCSKSGLFLDMSVLTDPTLEKISKYLKKTLKIKKEEEEAHIEITPETNNDNSSRTYKLSNYEKNIIKQRNLKKILNQDTDYQVLKVNS